MERAALINFDAEDVRLAVRHPDETVRALATQRICREMRDNALSDKERKFSHNLLKYIAKDMDLKDVKIKGRNFIIYHRLGWTSPVLPKIDPLNMFPSLCTDLFLIGYKEG